ncbi:MAG TPA: hypothetical protein VH817_16365 [Thermoleophilaceae bacterium]|jgi:hypothetical protein
MRGWFTSIFLATVLVVAVAVAVAGCGSQKRTIPTKQGQSLLGQLDKIEEQYNNGSCSGATAKVNSLLVQVRNLPSSVDSEVKKNLTAGVLRLRTLVAACKPAQPTNTTPTTAPTVPTQTVPTATIPTQTVPTQTVPTNTVPTGPTTTPTTPPPTTPGGGGGVTVPGSGTGAGGQTP